MFSVLKMSAAGAGADAGTARRSAAPKSISKSMSCAGTGAADTDGLGGAPDGGGAAHACGTGGACGMAGAAGGGPNAADGGGGTADGRPATDLDGAAAAAGRATGGAIGGPTDVRRRSSLDATLDDGTRGGS
jgi:hypothetical protein